LLLNFIFPRSHYLSFFLLYLCLREPGLSVTFYKTVSPLTAGHMLRGPFGSSDFPPVLVSPPGGAGVVLLRHPSMPIRKICLLMLSFSSKDPLLSWRAKGTKLLILDVVPLLFPSYRFVLPGAVL